MVVFSNLTLIIFGGPQSRKLLREKNIKQKIFSTSHNAQLQKINNFITKINYFASLLDNNWSFTNS